MQKFNQSQVPCFRKKSKDHGIKDKTNCSSIWLKLEEQNNGRTSHHFFNKDVVNNVGKDGTII